MNRYMFDKTMTHNRRMTMWKHALLLLMMVVGTIEAWGQTPKVPDGIYYIRNNAKNNGYLWPSVTTNTTTGYRYLTTSLDTSAPAVVNSHRCTHNLGAGNTSSRKYLQLHLLHLA